MRSRILGALLLLSEAGVLLAQDQAPEPGDRVRLTVPCDSRAGCSVVGRLTWLRPDSIAITTGDSTIRYPMPHVRRFQVSQGERSHERIGAVIGLVVGAGVTYLILERGGSTSLCDQSANQDAASSGECLGLTALGGAAGAGLGALIGQRIRTERWEDFSLSALQVGFTPSAGLRLGLAVEF
jgi:hypothetical protein